MRADIFIFHRFDKRVLRCWNKALGAWALCDDAPCRRARACRGYALGCMPGHFVSLPDGVQRFFDALAALAQRRGRAPRRRWRGSRRPRMRKRSLHGARRCRARSATKHRRARVFCSRPAAAGTRLRADVARSFHHLRAHNLRSAIAQALREAGRGAA
jgi:hypothetical protein